MIKNEILNLLGIYSLKIDKNVVRYNRLVSVIMSYAEKKVKTIKEFEIILENKENLEKLNEIFIINLNELEKENKVKLNWNDNKKKIISVEYKNYLYDYVKKQYESIKKDHKIQYPLKENLKELDNNIDEYTISESIKEFNKNNIEKDKMISLKIDSKSFIIVISNDLKGLLFQSALLKINSYLKEYDLEEYIKNKLKKMVGDEFNIKYFFENIKADKHVFFDIIKKGSDSIYKVVTSIYIIIVNDQKSNKENSAKFENTKSFIISLGILKGYMNYFRDINQENKNESELIKTINLALRKAPYYHIFIDIYKNVNKLHSIEEQKLMDLINNLIISQDHRYTVLIKKISLDGEKKNVYISYTAIPNLVFSKVNVLSNEFSDFYQKSWNLSLSSGHVFDTMIDKDAFDKHIKKRLEIKEPAIASVLNYDILINFRNNNVYKIPDIIDKELKEILNDEDNSIDYSKYLYLDNNALYEVIKEKIPVVFKNKFLRVIMLLIGVSKDFETFNHEKQKEIKLNPKIKSSKKKKNNSDDTEKQAKETKEENFQIKKKKVKDEKQVETKIKKSVPGEKTREDKLREIEELYAKNIENIEKELKVIEKKWNLMIDKKQRENLTEDVNNLCKDLVRKIQRGRKSNIPDILTLKTQIDGIIPNNTILTKSIQNKKDLQNYIELYIYKLLKF